MVVQHNMQAMNANRMLGTTTRVRQKQQKNYLQVTRLTVRRRCRGLSLPEKMRKQIKGLDQRSKAQDGISSVQTAEGALTNTSMLQRMNN